LNGIQGVEPSMQVVPLFFQLHIGLERPIFGLVIGMLVSMALSIDTDPGDLLPGPEPHLSAIRPRPPGREPSAIRLCQERVQPLPYE